MNKLENITWDDKKKTYFYNGEALTSKEAAKKYPNYKFQIEMDSALETGKATAIYFEEYIKASGEKTRINPKNTSIIEFNPQMQTENYLVYDNEEDDLKTGHFYTDNDRGIRIYPIAIKVTDTDFNKEEEQTK